MITLQTLKSQLEETQLIKFSLLPDELMSMSDEWSTLLDNFSESPDAIEGVPEGLSLAGMELYLSSEPNVRIHIVYPKNEDGKPMISLKGGGREEQERWQQVVNEKWEDSEFLVYQMVTQHLLPLLHSKVDAKIEAEPKPPLSSENPRLDESNKAYHALFTSHHLVSPTKRRNMQSWSSSLTLSGFAKVGYPGVIYAQGPRVNVEEFVGNVRGMQWLALKLRFCEPLPAKEEQPVNGKGEWKEFQKVGEVVGEMRRLGKEEYVVEMGIGSAGVT